MEMIYFILKFSKSYETAHGKVTDLDNIQARTLAINKYFCLWFGVIFILNFAASKTLHMQVTLFFLGTSFLFGLTYFLLVNISKKRFSKEKLIVHSHQKRHALLRNKVLQLFEIGKKHQHHLKVLANEIEQLQRDIALKHNAN